ncbi:LuxR C-terminal-related transcriptional regulator [Streptomyces sp. NBC_00009]
MTQNARPIRPQPTPIEDPGTTVQYHLTHIYAKLGVRSRSELAASFSAQ